MATPSPAGNARPLYLVHGADRLRARLRAAELAGRLSRGLDPSASDLARVPRGSLSQLGMGMTRLSAREATPADILMAARSDGLFAPAEERRVILVEDAEALVDSTVLRELPHEGVAVVLLANGASGVALARVVRELGGVVEEYARLDQSGAEAWLAKRAQTQGASLDRSALAALAESVEGDLERADRELEKLAAYAAGAVVTQRDVAALVAGAVENDVFELTRSVVRRDVRAALRILERLLDSGEPPLRLHGLLVWQFRVLLVAAGARTDAEVERAAAETGLSRGAVSRWRREASAVRPSQIRQAYESLYAADLAMKSGVDPRTAFQLLVLDLCGVEGADLGPLAERPARR